ncbi:MAG: hypothetical protein U0174_00700 [Polyangiaceae bacterium]
MMRKFSVVLGSLVGALAIHGALVACSSGGTTTNGPGGEGTAHADPTTTTPCSQWEVKTVLPGKYAWSPLAYTDKEGKQTTIDLPSIGETTLEPGWEPIGALYYSPLVRHCIK